ncbi:MAG: BrnT family toxin [Candidatus Omnitrophica bacterium]|nr:BrnT family toxin [Candidatus Omnitrophota bacterium]
MGNIYLILHQCSGFEWDKHNTRKNWEKHKITPYEAEQIFFNQPLIVADDEEHSQTERRFYALGRTDLNKKLFVVFTIRNKVIRVISARKMSEKEKRSYESNEK